MKKQFALLLAGVMLLTGCSLGAAPEPVDPNFPVTVGDLVMERRPAMVFSLTPAADEMVADLGFSELLAGVSDLCDLPAMAALPRVGGAYEPDITAIAEAFIPTTYEDKKTGEMLPGEPITGPKLVVTTVPLTDADLVALQQENVQILCLPRASSVQGIKDNYRALALALGGTENGAAAAEAVSSAMDAKLTEAKAVLKTLSEPMDAALLVEYPYCMATGDTLEGQLLAELGFTCSGGAYTGWLYPESELAALEPDVIFCAKEDEVETVEASYEYRSVAAAKNGKVTAIDFTAFERQSLRMWDLLAEMAHFAAE